MHEEMCHLSSGKGSKTKSHREILNLLGPIHYNFEHQKQPQIQWLQWGKVINNLEKKTLLRA